MGSSNELDTHEVMVSVVKEGADFKFSFTPELVEVHEKECRVVYKFDKSNTFGLMFAGAVFPQTQEYEAELININGILEDIKSVKIKGAGDKLVIKNKNKKHGLIGFNLLLCTKDGACYKSQDPQINNSPKL
ncbi:protein of unknown function [Shewanella benthica]|uniref:DP-EP family protein n=1 Tax=Shewanella benthica TaxID=43661 RepID=A0A330M9F9_9GAMM|nr:DP-EP family protein [Shewanella benthica]SQH78093.1 protein of unknown function [Shewanella benthica]